MTNEKLIELVESGEAKLYFKYAIGSYLLTLSDFDKEFPYFRNWHRIKLSDMGVFYNDELKTNVRGLKSFMQKRIHENEKKTDALFHVGSIVKIKSTGNYGKITELYRYNSYNIYRIESADVRWLSRSAILPCEEVEI